MKRNKLDYYWRIFLVAGLLLLSLTNCSSFSTGQSTINYKDSVTTQPLEIPPEFTTSSIDEQLVVPDLPTTTRTSIDFTHNRGQTVAGVDVLPQLEKVRIAREDNMRWLIVQAPPSFVWVKVKEFLQAQGFTLERQEPEIGVIETQWAKQQLNVPQTGLRKFLSNALNMVYSADIRDKYYIRLERGIEENSTEIYLTHQGAQEVAVGEDFRWQARPPEPGLEMEMLNRLMVFFGMEKETAETLLTRTETTSSSESNESSENESSETEKAPSLITRTQDGQLSLLLQEEIDMAWRRVGFALDRAKFTLADRDRQERIYYIRYIDPEAKASAGFWSNLFGGKSDKDKVPEYLLKLIPALDNTRVVVLTHQNQPAPATTAEKILTVLEEQIK